MTYHICPKCGRRIKCNKEAQSEQPAQTMDFLAHSFVGDSHVELSAMRAYPTLKYEVFWAESHMANTFFKVVAFTIIPVVASTTITALNGWSGVIPGYVFIISLCVFLRLFGKVPAWHNFIETEPPTPPVEAEPEDKREFAGWSLDVVNQTKTTMQIKMVEKWYTPPCPLDQAMSYALALVNNHFEWFDERHLKERGASISSGNYRALRRDWLRRKWCVEYGKKTIVTDKRMILKIAFDKPQ